LSNKEYSIDDVLTADEKKVIKINWKDGYIPFRLTPITHEQFIMLRKKVSSGSTPNSSDIKNMTRDDSALTNEIVPKCTEFKNAEGEWVNLSKSKFLDLPFGVTNRLTNEVIKLLGLGDIADELSNLSQQMTSPEQ